jgi:hypothetical protein
MGFVEDHDRWYRDQLRPPRWWELLLAATMLALAFWVATG